MTCRLLTTVLLGLLGAVLLNSCSSAYYSAMEKVGVHKRDIMVDRVEHAQKSQQLAQQQFKSALEQFQSVIRVEQTDLKTAFERLDGEYQRCINAAEDVSGRIKKIESVSEDLFDEWQQEIGLYTDKSLAQSSSRQLEATKARYSAMMKQMRRAEQSMAPVLAIFRDNVLYLKHNLNAQAIGALHREFTNLESEIDTLIKRMNEAISSSNVFLSGLKTS